MAIYSLLVMDADQAAAFRAETAGHDSILDPRLVEGGAWAGYYILPPAVLADADFLPQRAALSALSIEEIDSDEAWPLPPD